MSDLVTLGFKADTRGLLGAQRELDKTTAAGARLDKAALSLGKSMAAIATGMLAVTSAGAVKDTIFNFDNALKGLQATSRASTKDMAALEKQARTLGATSKFSATQAAEAQRFLAMAGFDTNKILSSTPAILKLATAGELSLAEAADIASNALGGLQLSVDHLDRVIDVMAETSATANTDIRQLAVAFKNAAPIATAAGVELEELSAIIGSLSDSGIQAERAGTGVLGIIRQLSNVSTDAERTLNAYGITLDQVSISQHGLTGVMKTLRDAGLSSGDAIKIFGSEAATAGLIAAASADHIEKMTNRYKDATGSANEMADIMAGSLTAGALGLGSAMSELALQIGDAGFSGAMKEGMLATTGFLHVFTGMLPEFAEANNLTAEYTSQLESFANIATITTGALGGMIAAMAVAKVATVGLAGVMGALNIVMLANPIALIIGSLAALTGSIYAARNMTVDFGDETIKVIDAVYGGFEVLKDGFNAVADTALGAYDYISSVFKDIAGESIASASVTSEGFATAFNDIYNLSKSFTNAVIATFVSLGKAIGIVAATIYIGFKDSFQNVQLIGEAFWKDFTGIFSGEAGLDNMNKAIKKALVDPMTGAMAAIKEETTKAFATDYIGDAAASLESSLGGVMDKFSAYTLAARGAREENERLAKELEMFSTFTETMNVPDWISKGSPIVPVVETKDAVNSLDELESKIDNFGGAWSRTGNIIIDAFGDMGDAMNSYMQSMDELSSMQKELEAERNKAGADSIKLNKLEQKINEKKVSAELSGYKALANGAAGMFSEKTAAAKAFTAISQVLAVTEIALSYQKMAASTTETGVHVANETTKQGANALTAITSAFAAPFPVNFAVGAAMIGIMTSLLGGSFGGGGGSSYEMPDEGGIGTVLGDPTAQSASIANVSDRYEDIELDQLAELKGIRDSMTKLSAGIQELAKSFVTDLNFTGSDLQLENSNFLDTGLGSTLRKIDPVAKVADWIDAITGDFLGLGGIVDKVFGGFSSKKQKLIDSGITFVSQTMAGIFESGELDASMYNVIETTRKKFWGLSKKKSTSTETQSLGGVINEQMGDIFGYLGESVIAAAESLGMDAKHIITTGIESLGLEDALKTFVIDIGDVSFLDKTGEEIQKELEAIFSQQGDLMAEYLVPSIKEYQQVGEGAFETLQRVAYEQAVFNDALERTGKSLSELSSLIQIDVAQSIITLVGGLENFAELSNKFFESFYTDAEQFAYLEKSLGEAFDSLGLSLVDSREEFKDLINGIDITTEAGQALYAALLELVPGMDEYLEALEDEENAKAEAAKRLAEQTQNVTLRLLKEQGKSEEALAITRQMELDAADESLHAMLKMIYALEDSAKAEAERAKEIQAAEQLLNQSKNLQIRLLNAQGESEAALALTREMELASADESLRGLLKMIYAQEDANKLQADAQNALEKTSNELENAVSGFRSVSESLNAIIYGAYDAIEAGATKLDDALKMSRTGDFSGASGLSVEGAIGNASNYDSIASYNFARDVALNKIAEIRDLSVSAEDVTERAIQAIDTNIANVAVDMFEQKASLSVIKDTNTSTDSNVLELVKTVKQDSEMQKESNKELMVLLDKMNKETVISNKLLKRIEYNAQYIIPTE